MGRAPAGEDEVVLREVLEGDLPVFFTHQSDPDAAALAAFPPRDRAAFRAHWLKILNDPAVTIRSVLWGGRLAGNVVSFTTPEGREVGYWIGREFWGLGIASRALGLFLEVERARPLFAHVSRANVGSVRVLEKCGFSLVETRRAPLVSGGEEVDEQVWRLDGGGGPRGSRAVEGR